MLDFNLTQILWFDKPVRRHTFLWQMKRTNHRKNCIRSLKDLLKTSSQTDKSVKRCFCLSTVPASLTTQIYHCRLTFYQSRTHSYTNKLIPQYGEQFGIQHDWTAGALWWPTKHPTPPEVSEWMITPTPQELITLRKTTSSLKIDKHVFLLTLNNF